VQQGDAAVAGGVSRFLPGANPEARFKWTKQLTKEETEKITIESVLAGSDGWNPAQP